MRIISFLLLSFLLLISCKTLNKNESTKTPEKLVKHFEPNWESLSQYECPEWFQDAKFGIYAHWGVYSTAKCPGTPDWYGHNMYVDGQPNNKFHTETYGALDKFGYKDMVTNFTASKFDADEWADLFVEAGARFAGPVGEHADGFSMWNSKVNP